MIMLPDNIVARLAQSVEHETLNLGVVGSSPTLGELPIFLICAKLRTLLSFKNSIYNIILFS